MNILGYDIDLISCLWLALDLAIFGLLIFGLFFQGRSRSKTIKIHTGTLPITPDHSAADLAMINREMDNTLDLLLLDLEEAQPFNNAGKSYDRLFDHFARLRDLDTIRIEADFEDDLLG